MCGIAGVAGAGAAGLDGVQKMLASLSHRGPDGLHLRSIDDGRIVLGHARLAIIDLSPSGVQPMCRGDDLWITYNGEIYNYRALRRELESAGHRFISTSDTEVLLAGYQQWGESLLDHLEGIFALALWDGTRRRLWLARDHLGVKPLYYSHDSRSFGFASEPRALLALGGRAPRPDRAAIRDFLSFGYIPGARSAFEGIAKLPAAHALIWEDGRFRTYRYWNAEQYAGEAQCDQADVVERTRRLLDESVELQLESDVPVGLLISGGIDSSAVASSVARRRERMEGFVIGFDEATHDEREFARLLAGKSGIELSERVVAAQATDALIGELSAAHDEPLADSSTLPSLALFRLVHDHRLKVVLGGDGGDELFGGYRRYDRILELEGHSQAPWPVKLIGAKGWRHALTMAAMPVRYGQEAWRAYYERVRLFSFEQQRDLLRPEWSAGAEEELVWPFREFWNEDLETVKAAQVFDLQTYLPNDILTKVDRASMHFGVEARVPLLAHRMVEFALSISTHLHRSGGRRKHVLKASIQGRVPDALLSNRKRGFSLPLESVVGQRLRAWMAGIEKSSLVTDGVISRDAARWIGTNLDQAWALYALELWWSRWMRGSGTAEAQA
jgi:asparagine synthase (glutamine-hydrolysing)